uniref:Uncharacterized protein n=1 Tax=Aegilops tauschii subsp. strangulata TaxID=200361 RepID=A0A453BUZ5_AEGTS
RCFPLLVPLLVPHGEPWEGEGSIFVIDLLSDGGGLPRAWRARAVPSRRRSALRDAACLPGPSPLAQPRLPPWSSRSRPTQSRRPELRRSTLPPPSSWGPDCGRGGACPCRPAAPAPTGSSTSPAAPATLPSSVLNHGLYCGSASLAHRRRRLLLMLIELVHKCS